MKLLCISDIHNQFGDYTVGDLPDSVLITGDLTNWRLRDEAKGYGEMVPSTLLHFFFCDAGSDTLGTGGRGASVYDKFAKFPGGLCYNSGKG